MSNATFFSQEWFIQEANNPEYLELLSEANKQRDAFLDKYSFKKLKELSGDDILTVMFQSENKSENMCSDLLSQKTNYFVGVGQGSMHQFLLFYDYGNNEKKKNNPGESGWTTGSSANEKKISREDAMILAKGIRDSIVKISEYIEQNDENDPSTIDYSHLRQLFKEAGFNENQRFLKYFAISFPSIIPVFYNSEWHIRLFSLLEIEPSDNMFSRLGQIAMYIHNTGIDPIVFANIVFHHSDQLHGFKTWKISHGILSEEQREKLLSRQMIAMSSDTKALGRSRRTQGEFFTEDLKKGDYIFLCFGSTIKLIGIIDDDSPRPNEELGTNWVERHYRIIKKSISDQRYTGNKKRWTPNDNSTFVEVPTSDYLLYESNILSPYFNLRLKDLFIESPNLEIEDEQTKQERQSKMEKQGKLNISLNTILYGPPGTGKTYETIDYAVAIILDKDIESIKSARKNGEQIEGRTVEDWYNTGISKKQIAFATFHQSYGYEEFIEGIRPYTDSDTSELRYRIEPGLFLEFCNDDLQETSSIDVFELSWQKLEKEAYEKGKEYQFTRSTGSKFTGVLVEDAFRVIWKTGTFNTLAKSNIRDQWEKKINRDELSGGNIWAFDARQAIIDEMQKKYDLPEFDRTLQTKDESKNKVFIIDEINRGNISKIFGELITLIEDTKREKTSVILPYSKKPFTVPKNVFILGTMNTADRSIATIDTALRRRFHFIEMQPNPEILNDVVIEGLNVGELLSRMNKKIALLYDREHTIGHAYFTSLKEKEKPCVEDLAKIFEDSIIPLLQEYFYEDYEKIRLVLGDNKKNNKEIEFITIDDNDFVDLFGNSIDDFEERKTYSINRDAMNSIEAYKVI